MLRLPFRLFSLENHLVNQSNFRRFRVPAGLANPGEIPPPRLPAFPVIAGLKDYGRIPLRVLRRRRNPAVGGGFRARICPHLRAFHPPQLPVFARISPRKFPSIYRKTPSIYRYLSNFSEIRFSSNEAIGSAIIPESPSCAGLANAGKFTISPGPETAAGERCTKSRHRAPRPLHRTRPAGDVPVATGRFRHRTPGAREK